MKLSVLIRELQSVHDHHGDIEAQIQYDANVDIAGEIRGTHDLFIVPEEYRPEDGGWTCNIRGWPY